MDISCPGILTDVIAFIDRNEAELGEVDFRLVASSGNIEADPVADPFAVVCSEIEMVGGAKPDHPSVGGDLD